eukprot:4329318-Amphidinium_carterae.1
MAADSREDLRSSSLDTLRVSSAPGWLWNWPPSSCHPPGCADNLGSVSSLSWTSCASRAATRCRTEEVRHRSGALERCLRQKGLVSLTPGGAG